MKREAINPQKETQRKKRRKANEKTKRLAINCKVLVLGSRITKTERVEREKKYGKGEEEKTI